MKKLIKILLLVICLLSFIKMIFCCFNYKNEYKEYEKSITGIIVLITKKSDKVIIHIKNKKKYQITIYDDINYELGDKILVTGTFCSANNNTVFNLFNYRKYLLSKNIYMIIKPSKIKLISKNNNIFYKIKNKIIKHIDTYQSKAYLKTFLLGDSSEIEDNVKKNYQSLGISHLMAISGTHISAILVVINIFMKRYKHKNIITFLILFFYLFLTNFMVSLQRALLFFFLKYLNKRFDLQINSIYILIVTVFLLLLLNPFIIYNVGFLFSSVISFFIILLKNKLLKEKDYFKKLILISIVSFFASIPILAFYFFKINLLSILFNILFVPVISLVIFPLSIITIIFPFLDELFLFITNLLENTSIFLLTFNIFNIAISKPSILFILLYYSSLFLSIKFKKSYIIIFIFTLILNINSRFFIIYPEITFLDVGQGDCIIFVFPFGKTVAIDTGGSYFNKEEISKNKIIPYLNSKGIDKIEWLILTHGDYDHMGEAVNLVNNLKIQKVIFNCGPYNDLENELIKALKKKKINYYSCIKELNVGNNKLYFLNTKEYDNENDNSNVIYTELNNFKFLFMGDASNLTEKEILDKYNLSNIDVLKVGHHGSKTSSSKKFIDTIDPKFSLISVGENNRYGHPNKEVLDNLKDSKIYRTDIDGSVMFEIKKNKLKIKRCPP